MVEKEIKMYFKKAGYSGRSITEIWYRDPRKIRNDLDKLHSTLGQKIERIIRWKTSVGKKTLGEIHNYIRKEDEKTRNINAENFRNEID